MFAVVCMVYKQYLYCFCLLTLNVNQQKTRSGDKVNILYVYRDKSGTSLAQRLSE